MQGTVSKILIDAEGDCSGVELSGGRILEAGRVILASGGNTSKILADSAPDRPEMQAGKRIAGAAVVTGAMKLTKEQAELYKDIPLFLHRVGGVNGTLDRTQVREAVVGWAYSLSFFRRDLSSNTGEYNEIHPRHQFLQLLSP